MKLEHSFTVPAELETVWQAVLDPERVAPCMPGATLSEVDGDAFKGSVKVKVGPISLLYKGAGEILSKDAESRTVVIKASGKDARGNGTAAATVTVSLRAADADADSTVGNVVTDLSITGKPAQFGRGLISEVGGKILDSFAACLAAKLAPVEEAPPLLSVVSAAHAEAAETGRAAGEAAAEHAPASTPGSVKPKLAAAPDPESEPIDLIAFAGPSVVKRTLPLMAAGAAVLAFVAVRRRRR